MSEMPWGNVLALAMHEQANRLAEVEAENAELRERNTKLKLTAVNLRRRVYAARYAQARWLLRQQSWRAERDELLRRLSLAGLPTTPGLNAYKNWGPGS